jgi:hypothetical protein
MGKVPLYTISGGGHGDPGCANDRVCDLLNPEIHARLDRGEDVGQHPLVACGGFGDYRGTSHIRKRLALGPYSRTMPSALRWS